MTFLPYLEAFEFLWSWMKRKPKPEPVPPPALPPAKPKILVVEDNPSDSQFLDRDLKYCGQSATFASTAEAAEALIQRNSIDIIFVDLRLTYMNGWDLIPLIWRHSPHSVVVVICGEISDLSKIPKPHRMMIVMIKPVNADNLCELFEKLKAFP